MGGKEEDVIGRMNLKRKEGDGDRDGRRVEGRGA